MATELQRSRDAALAQADKLEREVDHLLFQVDSLDVAKPNQDVVNLSLAQAKRVKSKASRLVQSLAQLRDHLQSD